LVEAAGEKRHWLRVKGDVDDSGEGNRAGTGLRKRARKPVLFWSRLKSY
jgi:hypothetical protein